MNAYKNNVFLIEYIIHRKLQSNFFTSMPNFLDLTQTIIKITLYTHLTDTFQEFEKYPMHLKIFTTIGRTVLGNDFQIDLIYTPKTNEQKRRNY